MRSFRICCSLLPLQRTLAEYVQPHKVTSLGCHVADKRLPSRVTASYVRTQWRTWSRISTTHRYPLAPSSNIAPQDRCFTPQRSTGSMRKKSSLLRIDAHVAAKTFSTLISDGTTFQCVDERGLNQISCVSWFVCTSRPPRTKMPRCIRVNTAVSSMARGEPCRGSGGFLCLLMHLTVP